MKKRIVSMLLTLVMVMGMAVSLPKIEASAVSKCYWPVDTKHGITQNYSGSHSGVDIGAPTGTPIYSTFDGTAQFYQVYTVIGNVKYLTSYGNAVYVTADDGTLFAIYGHMNAFNGFSLQIPSSQTRNQSGNTGKILIGTKKVKTGDLLGYVGNTGRSSGSHLHFELRKSNFNGAVLNPNNYLDRSKCANSVSNNPPTNVHLEKNQYWYDIKDTITLTPHADGATGIWMSIIDANGNSRVNTQLNGPYNIHASTLGYGKYRAWISAANAAGSVDSATIEFSVVGAAGYHDVWTSSPVYDLNDTVSISVSTQNAKGQVIGIDKEGGGRVVTKDCDTTFTKAASELGVGTYSAYFSVYNGSGGVDTKRVSFVISDRQNLGTDFYARIKNTKANKYMTNESSNVIGKDLNCSSSQVWKFVRQSDGSYKFINALDGGAMDVKDYGSAGGGTNVQMNSSWDTTAQRFYIYKAYGAYYIKPVCCNLFVDMGIGSDNNVAVWGGGADWAPQKFAIEKIDSANIGKHKYTTTTTPPTCVNSGKKVTKCSVCGDTKTETIPAKGHSFGNWTVTKAPTCTEKGVETRTCACGAKENRDIAAKGHTFGGWTVTKAPTCTEKGVETRTCACGVKENRDIAAKGHAYSDWITTKEPTCTQEGIKTQTCSLCGNKITEAIPKIAHDTEWIVIKEPTGMEDGLKQLKCKVCGAVIDEDIIPSLGYIDQGNCGAGTSWILGKDGTLTISGTGIVKNYDKASLVPWNKYASQIKSVVVEEGVTRIGEFAFYGCANLTSVTLPNSLKEINGYVFKNCSSLTEITLPKNLLKIGDSAFYGTGLTRLTIPTNVNYIGWYAFSRCYSLKNVEFTGNAPEFAGKTFNMMTATVNYPVGNTTWTAAKKQPYGGTIKWLQKGLIDEGLCGSTTSWKLSNDGTLTISGTGIVKNYSSYTLVPWLKYASQIKKVVVEEGVTRIGEFAFYGCTNLTSVTLPSSLKEINGYVFKNCSSLTQITLPSGLTKIGDSAFYGTGLTSIVIPSKVNYIGYYAFSRCYSLSNIEFKGSAPAFCTNVFNKVVAFVYYPAGNSSWNSVAWNKLGGTLAPKAK